MTPFKKALAVTAIVSFGFVFGNTAYAEQADIYKIEEAMATLDVSALQEMQSELDGYELALAKYRLALSANLSNKADISEDALHSAMQLLETLDEEQPDNVEIKALLAQVYGYKVAISPMKAFYYGPKSQRKLSEAEKLAPNNPRVLLIKGIGAVNTPPMFGGDRDLAIDAFNKAISAFADDEYSSYHWGFAEAHTWRGILMQQDGNLEGALADWNKALQIDPEYGWAKSLIAQANK